MHIAIDISPLQTGHKVRGTGFYLHNLKKSLEQYFPNNQYTFFIQKQKLPNTIELIHYPYFDPFFITLPFQKNVKTVVTVHDLTPIVFSKEFPSGIKGTIKWQLQKHNLQKVDAIITDSENSKKDIVRFIKYPAEKVHVVYLAAGEEFKKLQITNFKFQMLKKKYNLPEKFALYVGDVTWNKNLPRLIKAVEKAEVPLVMVGKALVQENFDKTNLWNKDLIEVQTLSKNNKNIIRLGFVSTEELVLLYNIATLFVMPSLYEGFGLPIIEAMSCGVPVITTKRGSLSEVAEESAYYVDGYSIEDIVNGIKEVFENSQLRKELSEKGLKQSQKFTWKKTTKQTIEVYKNVLSNQGEKSK